MEPQSTNDYPFNKKSPLGEFNRVSVSSRDAERSFTSLLAVVSNKRPHLEEQREPIISKSTLIWKLLGVYEKFASQLYEICNICN